MKKCLILANGKPPSKKDLNYFLKAGFNFLICADGGANSAYKLGVHPDLIIGDLDSIDSYVLEYFSKDVDIVKYSRQNDTDVEKALKYAISKKFTEAILLGATGDRLDHTFCNLGIVLKFFNKIQINIFHEKTFLSAFDGIVKLKSEIGETISIYGFDDKTKITSSGLKYKLNNSALPFGVRESTSNVSTKDIITLQVENGKIFVIRQLNVLKRIGYFFYI